MSAHLLSHVVLLTLGRAAPESACPRCTRAVYPRHYALLGCTWLNVARTHRKVQPVAHMQRQSEMEERHRDRDQVDLVQHRKREILSGRMTIFGGDAVDMYHRLIEWRIS